MADEPSDFDRDVGGSVDDAGTTGTAADAETADANDAGGDEPPTDESGWIFGTNEEQRRPTSDDQRRASAPLEDLARELDERRTRSMDSATPGQSTTSTEDELFDSVDVGKLDSEAVWDSLLSEDEPDSVGGAVTEVEVSTEADDRPEYVVSKREYCQRCQYFTAPPEVSCTYEGSDIVSVEDFETFRVRGCPVVDGNELDRVD